jgi:hypothetical protein
VTARASRKKTVTVLRMAQTQNAQRPIGTTRPTRTRTAHGAAICASSCVGANALATL